MPGFVSCQASMISLLSPGNTGGNGKHTCLFSSEQRQYCANIANMFSQVMAMDIPKNTMQQSVDIMSMLN